MYPHAATQFAICKFCLLNLIARRQIERLTVIVQVKCIVLSNCDGSAQAISRSIVSAKWDLWARFRLRRLYFTAFLFYSHVNSCRDSRLQCLDKNLGISLFYSLNHSVLIRCTFWFR